MREIKFRSWDILNKVMEINIHHLDSLNEYLSKDHKIVMQYTGLKDNSAQQVEIYEGDLVSLHGIVIGNIYEMDKRESDIVIQDFGGKNWSKTYNEAISRGCRHTQ